MTLIKKTLLFTSLMSLMVAGAACAPEVGTEAWCKKMKEKPKADWTANEAADYAKYCLFENYKDKKKE